LERKFVHPFYVINGLSEQAIVGVDFIHKNIKDYSSIKREFHWFKIGTSTWDEGVIRVRATQIGPPLTIAAVQVNTYSEGNTRSGTDSECLAQVAAPRHLLLTGNPSLIRINSLRQLVVYVQNCSATEVQLDRDELLGMVENTQGLQVRLINAEYVNSVRRG
jgi:hypothetical protein